MPSSLCKALLVCMLIVTMQSFEFVFLRCNVVGISTGGKDVSLNCVFIYLFVYSFLSLVIETEASEEK